MTVSFAGKPRGRLSTQSIRAIIQRRAQDAGIEGRVSGHLLRVGSAQSLTTAGASVVELQTAGRWPSSLNLKWRVGSEKGELMIGFSMTTWLILERPRIA